MTKQELRDRIACYLCGEKRCDHLPIEMSVKCPPYLSKANHILALPEIAKALEYYRIMHSPGHDVEKYYKEG